MATAWWRWVALGALVFVLVAGRADAHHSRTSRVHNMREVALAYWGDITTSCDRSVMDIPIMREFIPPDRDAAGHVTYRYNGLFVHRVEDTDDPPFHDCKILIQDKAWDTELLCRVVVHEMGHARAWRAPPGQEYVDGYGQADRRHSRDPASIMWPFALSSFEPCWHVAEWSGAQHRPGAVGGRGGRRL